MRDQRGFTLLELIIVTSLSTIVLCLALPALSAGFERMRAQQVATELYTALNLARSTAVGKGQYAVVCAEAGQSGHCSNNWLNGFMVFMDEDGDNQRDEDETILQHFTGAAGRSLKLGVFGNRNRISYRPDGTLRYYSAASFTYCPAEPDDHLARQVIINRMGRVRHAQDNNHNGIQEDSLGHDLHCQ